MLDMVSYNVENKKVNVWWFLFKALMHFIYVSITNPLGFKHTYHLKFKKEDDGRWFIDMPDWPFSHDNLEMVTGAASLCELLNEDGIADVEVVTCNRKLKGYEGYNRCERKWAYLQWGGGYDIPTVEEIEEVWLCQVTLFVIGWWPKYIYTKKYDRN